MKSGKLHMMKLAYGSGHYYEGYHVVARLVTYCGLDVNMEVPPCPDFTNDVATLASCSEDKMCKACYRAFMAKDREREK